MREAKAICFSGKILKSTVPQMRFPGRFSSFRVRSNRKKLTFEDYMVHKRHHFYQFHNHSNQFLLQGWSFWPLEGLTPLPLSTPLLR